MHRGDTSRMALPEILISIVVDTFIVHRASPGARTTASDGKSFPRPSTGNDTIGNGSS